MRDGYNSALNATIGSSFAAFFAGYTPKKIPTLADTVVTQYRGTFVDGKEFDNSYKREPFITPVTNVIKGWTEALSMMPVGSKWQLVLPPDLGYGAVAHPPVPPNSTLLFDMELIAIQDKSEKPK